MSHNTPQFGGVEALDRWFLAPLLHSRRLSCIVELRSLSTGATNPAVLLRSDALRDASPKLRQPRQLVTCVALRIPRLVDRVAGCCEGLSTSFSGRRVR